ncbi:ankyrin repeat-containing domain protein [Aspergillus taichungensis]|uniref:Ankyrin repeat-containing domain protein n=1 Tax=Aspergillus taichungensis TaxID=482145 RepID=A0A2J5I7X6_9EURO|nr:ankyrin repeat-containing domain protein [Aspergillus taichungensis]
MPALFSLAPELFLQILSYLPVSAISSLARTNTTASTSIMPMLYRKNIIEGKGSALVHLADNDYTNELRDYIDNEMSLRLSERRTLRTDNVFFSYDPNLTNGTKAQYQARRRYQAYEHANYGPLVRAVHRGAHETVDLLVGMGFDPAARSDTPQRSLLAYAASNGYLKNTQTILEKLRTTAKGCPNYVLEEAVSAAATNRHPLVVRYLLTNISNQTHTRANTLIQELCRANLPAAVVAGRVSLCQVLMVWLRSVDFHNSQFSGTPLQLAVRNGHPTIVRMLLMRGAEPDAVVPRMNLLEGSAFTEAARLGNEEIIEALTVAGARDNVRNIDGLTAKDYLKRNNERKEREERDRQQAREAQAEQRQALNRLSRNEHEFEAPGTINARISATCTCGSSYFRDH